MPSFCKIVWEDKIKKMDHADPLQRQLLETGSYLALDVGGTNLRVVSVHLAGGGEIITRQTKYRIDEKLKVGESKALFGKSRGFFGPRLRTEAIAWAPFALLIFLSINGR